MSGALLRPARADREDWQARARHKRDELAARIDELAAARQLIDAALACGCTDLEGWAAHPDAQGPQHRS